MSRNFNSSWEFPQRRSEEAKKKIVPTITFYPKQVEHAAEYYLNVKTHKETLKRCSKKKTDLWENNIEKQFLKKRAAESDLETQVRGK